MSKPKTPYTFHINDLTLAKIKQIAKAETRSVSNLIEHLCRMCVIEFEKNNGEITVGDEDYVI